MMPDPIPTVLHCTETHETGDLRAYQATAPLHLTNASCEVANGDAALLAALGIEFGDHDGTYYPLTREESVRLAEGCVPTRFGVFLTGYAVLFANRKWFGPVIEAGFQAERNGWDPTLPTRDACLATLATAAEEMEPAVAALGGHLILTADAFVGDRHSLQILLETDRVCRLCPDHQSFAALLVVVTGGLASPLPRLDAAPERGGDYYVIELTTSGSCAHVASVVCWEKRGIADATSISHANQLKVAGPLLQTTCGLLRALITATGATAPHDELVSDTLNTIAAACSDKLDSVDSFESDPSLEPHPRTPRPGVAQPMSEAGYTLEHTGGGCMAWEKDVEANGDFLRITYYGDRADGDPSRPAWAVGRYGRMGGWINLHESFTLAEAVRAAELLPSPILPDGNLVQEVYPSLEDAVRSGAALRGEEGE